MVCHPGKAVVCLPPCPREDEREDLSVPIFVQARVNDSGCNAVHLLRQRFARDTETGVHSQESTQQNLVAVDAASELLSGLRELKFVVDQCHLLCFKGCCAHTLNKHLKHPVAVLVFLATGHAARPDAECGHPFIWVVGR